MNSAERMARTFEMCDVIFEAEDADTPEITTVKLKVNASIFELLNNMANALVLINKRNGYDNPDSA